MDPIAPKEIRYIKLGPGGAWEDRCLSSGEIHFGYADVPHELCSTGGWEAVAHLLMDRGRKQSKATDAVREIRDFYTLGADCLWITFARNRLWWTFAEPEVIWSDEDGAWIRMRRTIGPWRDQDITGEPLSIEQLSTKLTQTAAYRQTICRIKPEEYLLRRINGIDEPIIARAKAAQAELIGVTKEMIQSLHWADFETLVDLIFARSGWQRVSRVGGSQKDFDIVLEQPATGERAFVQVKSQANQAVLNDYVVRFHQSGIYDRMFFVCHSPASLNQSPDPYRIAVWERDVLASMVVKVGLLDWLIKKLG